MTELTPIVPTRQPPPYSGSTRTSAEAAALSLEIAKCLKLVAPSTMNADAQLAWLASAVDALEGISPREVFMISPELRRTVTRPAQIVPEIARLVDEHRKRNARPTHFEGTSEYQVDQEAEQRRHNARGRDQVEAAWRWERTARQDAGLAVPPIEKPFSGEELDNMDPRIRSLGLKYGHLIEKDGIIVEAS